MNCPVCNDVRMREVEKDGILIDICPSCKGVWLDRGELEKLMSGVREIRQDFNQWYDDYEPQHKSSPPSQQSYPPQQSYPSHPSHSKDNLYSKDHPSNYKQQKKKKSVLDVFGDLFD